MHYACRHISALLILLLGATTIVRDTAPTINTSTPIQLCAEVEDNVDHHDLVFIITACIPVTLKQVQYKQIQSNQYFEPQTTASYFNARAPPQVI